MNDRLVQCAAKAAYYSRLRAERASGQLLQAIAEAEHRALHLARQLLRRVRQRLQGCVWDSSTS